MKHRPLLKRLTLVAIATLAIGCDEEQRESYQEDRSAEPCSPEYLTIPADCVVARDGSVVDGNVPTEEIDYPSGEDYISGFQDDSFATTRVELNVACLGDMSVDVDDLLQLDGSIGFRSGDAHPEPIEQSMLQVTSVSQSGGTLTANVSEVGLGDLQIATRQLSEGGDTVGKTAEEYWNDLVNEVKGRTTDFLKGQTTIDESYEWNNGIAGLPVTATFKGNVHMEPTFELSNLNVQWLKRKLTSLTATLTTELRMDARFDLKAGGTDLSASRNFSIADSGWQNHTIGWWIFGLKMRYRMWIDADMTAVAAAGFEGEAGIHLEGSPKFTTSFTEDDGWSFDISDPPSLTWHVPQVAQTDTRFDAGMELKPHMVFEVAGERFAFDLVGALTFEITEPQHLQAEIVGKYSLKGKALMQWKKQPAHTEDLVIIPDTTQTYNCSLAGGSVTCALPS